MFCLLKTVYFLLEKAILKGMCAKQELVKLFLGGYGEDGALELSIPGKRKSMCRGLAGRAACELGDTGGTQCSCSWHTGQSEQSGGRAGLASHQGGVKLQEGKGEKVCPQTLGRSAANWTAGSGDQGAKLVWTQFVSHQLRDRDYSYEGRDHQGMKETGRARMQPSERLM